MFSPTIWIRGHRAALYILAPTCSVKAICGIVNYFPKGTDLSTHSPQRLLEVANELNDRPRKTRGGSTPTQAIQRLLFEPEEPNVATTA